jgi:LEA14-like dessication related protein
MKNNFKKYIGIFIAVLFFTACYDDFKMVTVTAEKSKILKLDKNGIELEITMRIKNPNPFSFNIYKSDLQASINDIDLGQLKVDRKIHVRRNSDDTHTFKVASDFSKMSITDLPKLMNLAKGGTLHLKGELKVGKFFYKKKLPIDRKEKISF